jgi:hypothetical protein
MFMQTTKSKLATALIAVSVICSGMTAPMAYAQSEASAISALSALPIASVVVGASAVAGSVIAVPIVLSTTGAVLVVKTVESTARGTIYVLERASDGARVSLEIAGKAVTGSVLFAGASVLVIVVGAGVVLSVAGEAIAFLPNAIGNALLHSERLTY